jgi:hypothetical protein
VLSRHTAVIYIWKSEVHAPLSTPRPFFAFFSLDLSWLAIKGDQSSSASITLLSSSLLPSSSIEGKEADDEVGVEGVDEGGGVYEEGDGSSAGESFP